MQEGFNMSVENMKEGFNKAIERTANEQITQFKAVTEILSKENKAFVNELIQQIHKNDKGLFKGFFWG